MVRYACTVRNYFWNNKEGRITGHIYVSKSSSAVCNGVVQGSTAYQGAASRIWTLEKPHAACEPQFDHSWSTLTLKRN